MKKQIIFYSLIYFFEKKSEYSASPIEVQQWVPGFGIRVEIFALKSCLFTIL
jgi:hypothetical protein